HTLLFLEDKIKRLVQSYIERGRVDVYINIEGRRFTQKSLQADWDLIDQYVHLLKNVQERYDLNKVLSQRIIPEIPDLITVEEYDECQHEITDESKKNIERGWQQVIMMRQEEGRIVMADIKKRMKSIRNMLLLAERKRKYVILEYPKRTEE